MTPVLAALLFAAAASAAPAAPAQAGKPRPPAGAIAQRTLPGGWLVEVAGALDGVEVAAPGFSAASGRVLLLTAATSEDRTRLVSSQMTLLGPDGKPVRTESLAANRAYDGDLSPDGKLAAVIAHPYVTTGEEAFLFALDETGKKWRKPARVGARVLAGQGWIATFEPPLPAAAAHDEEEGSVLPRAERAATFLAARDGAPRKPPQPIAGALARGGNVLASVAGAKLHLHDASTLARKASADVGFTVGFPSVAAGGSLVAVADFASAAPDGRSAVALFDGSGKPLGSFAMKASVGVGVAIAPDGAAVLAAPAGLGIAGPVAPGPGSVEPLAIALFDRSGKERWRHEAKRKSPEERFTSLSLAKGGTRAAAVIAGGDPEGSGRVMVFGAKGEVLYEAEGDVASVWLDATGEWLYTVEPGAFSRLSIKALRAGTAFPESDPDGDGPDIEAEIDAEDAKQIPGGPATFPEDKPPR